MMTYLYVRHPAGQDGVKSLTEEFELPINLVAKELEQLVGEGTLFSIESEHDGITDVLTALTEHDLASYDQLYTLLDTLEDVHNNERFMAGLKYAIETQGLSLAVEDPGSWEENVVSGPFKGSEKQARMEYAKILFMEMYSVQEEATKYVDFEAVANDFESGKVYTSVEYLNEVYIVRLSD